MAKIREAFKLREIKKPDNKLGNTQDAFRKAIAELDIEDYLNILILSDIKKNKPRNFMLAKLSSELTVLQKFKPFKDGVEYVRYLSKLDSFSKSMKKSRLNFQPDALSKLGVDKKVLNIVNRIKSMSKSYKGVLDTVDEAKKIGKNHKNILDAAELVTDALAFIPGAGTVAVVAKKVAKGGVKQSIKFVGEELKKSLGQVKKEIQGKVISKVLKIEYKSANPQSFPTLTGSKLKRHVYPKPEIKRDFVVIDNAKGEANTSSKDSIIEEVLEDAITVVDEVTSVNYWVEAVGAAAALGIAGLLVSDETGTVVNTEDNTTPGEAYIAPEIELFEGRKEGESNKAEEFTLPISDNPEEDRGTDEVVGENGLIDTVSKRDQFNALIDSLDGVQSKRLNKAYFKDADKTKGVDKDLAFSRLSNFDTTIMERFVKNNTVKDRKKFSIDNRKKLQKAMLLAKEIKSEEAASLPKYGSDITKVNVDTLLTEAGIIEQADVNVVKVVNKYLSHENLRKNIKLEEGIIKIDRGNEGWVNLATKSRLNAVDNRIKEIKKTAASGVSFGEFDDFAKNWDVLKK